VVKPFFRDHFARIDRQVVLVDALGAIHAGPRAVDDLRLAMADILSAFRPGRNAFLSQLLLGKRVERILFAATKADHLHHSQHPQLTAIMEAILREAKDRADFAGARTAAMSIASLRATTEDTISTRAGARRRARHPREHRQARGDVSRESCPRTPRSSSRRPGSGAEAWLDADYAVMSFAPQPLVLKPGEGPPHIRLDRAAEFLFGDRLG
jgi:uncharacterized protein